MLGCGNGIGLDINSHKRVGTSNGFLTAEA